MVYRTFQQWIVLIPLLGLVLLAGCSGSKPVNVKGKLILPKDMKLSETDNLSVGFASEDEKSGKSVSTSANVKDLTFDCKEVIPGKYKVVINVGPYAGMPGSDKRARELRPFNMAHDNAASKITYEVSADPTQTITIDLGKDTVIKN